jgi:hypothetical protein
MNERLHPNLNIARVAWTKRTLNIGKRYGSLIVETYDIETANRLIAQGIVHEGEIKYCERFIKEARIIQCIRCNQFGHSIKVCHNRTTCGNCAGDHHSKECDKPHTIRKCALCKGDHQAWAKHCPARLREVERANIVLQTTSAFYGDSPHTCSPNKTMPTHTYETNSEGWQVVGKGRKGRPSSLIIAARDPNQTRIDIRGQKRRRESTPGPTQDSEAEDEIVAESTQALLLATDDEL